MAIAIIPPGEPGAFALTSPPAKPEPKPDDSIVAKVMSYADRDVYVTYPSPDTIVLTASITNEMHVSADISGKAVKQIYTELDQELCDHVQALPITEGCGVKLVKLIAGPANKCAAFSIEFAPHQKAVVTLRRQPKPDYPVWTLHLEFSVSRAGKAGLQKIEDGFDIAVPMLIFDKVLGSARLARVDAAIDCIGAVPLDLIAHAHGQGKRQAYLADNGGPEAVYVFAQKPLPQEYPKNASFKTRGTHLLTLYERRALYRQYGLQPPFGDCPVTRAEVARRWKNNRPRLADLSAIKNMFAKRRVAYAAAVPASGSPEWHAFCLDAFAQGPLNAQHNPYSPARIAMAKLYMDCAGDLIDPSSWSGWPTGLSGTGLDAWVERAKKFAE